MDLDPVLLARLQFAFSISFHILFPAFTIGLAAWIVVLEALWLSSGSAVHGHLSRFWTRIFAVSFGMGVVSGIVMSFQFGTNWSELSNRAGNVLGPLLHYEVLTRVLPRGVVPRHPAVRPRSGTALGALRRRLRRGGGHADLGVLDPRRQQLDADAAGYELRDGHVPRHQLVAGGVQSLVPVSLRAHGHRGVPDHRVRGRRRERLASPERACGAARRGRPVHGARPDHGARAGAADPRRPARAEHVRAPARQGGGDGGPLGDPCRRAVRAVRPA